MVQNHSRSGFPVGNPIANVLVAIAGLLTIAVSVVVGFVALLVLGAIVLVVAAVIGLRVWWFNRQLRRQAGAKRPGEAGGGPSSVIEGEYRVISRDRHEA
jgi:Flp pilus assembly protein TadB